MLEAITRQIGAEFGASFSYLAMAGWCEHHQFMGAGKWLRTQSAEEHAHATKLFNFVLARNFPVDLPAIEKPASDFASVAQVFERALTKMTDAFETRAAELYSSAPGSSSSNATSAA